MPDSACSADVGARPERGRAGDLGRGMATITSPPAAVRRATAAGRGLLFFDFFVFFVFLVLSGTPAVSAAVMPGSGEAYEGLPVLIAALDLPPSTCVRPSLTPRE